MFPQLMRKLHIDLFLVKEEKLLLIAQETGTDKATYDAIRNKLFLAVV